MHLIVENKQKQKGEIKRTTDKRSNQTKQCLHKTLFKNFQFFYARRGGGSREGYNINEGELKVIIMQYFSNNNLFVTLLHMCLQHSRSASGCRMEFTLKQNAHPTIDWLKEVPQ